MRMIKLECSIRLIPAAFTHNSYYPYNVHKLPEIKGIKPLVYPSTCPEDLPRSLPLAQYVEQTARQKSINVSCQLKKDKIPFDVVIGCDTMVSIDDQLVGKPRDQDDALAILKMLKGRAHSVRTGVCLISSQGQEELFSVETQVNFGQICEHRLRQYVASGEPMGRAGAYAIQGMGAALISEIHGSFSNVVGLPLYEVAEKLTKMITHT